MLYLLISNALVGLFQGKLARGAPPTISVDASIRAVAANVWGEVAEARGLRMSVDPTLSMRVEDGEGVCEVTLVGEKADTFTVARKTGETGISGRFAVAPATWGRRMTSGLTGRRVALGDDALDRTLVAMAEPKALAATLFTPEVRDLLSLLAHRDPHLFIDARGMSLQLEGTEMVHEHLHAIWDWLLGARSR